LGGVVLDLQLAQVLHQSITEGESRPGELVGKDQRRIPKLTPVNMGVQAVGEAVALKPCGAILLGNDVGLLSGVQERPQAEGMVDMPVSVNSGMQGCLTPRPDRMVDGLRIL